MNQPQQGVPDDLLFDYGGRCWWCGSQADSREHKYKKSDVIRQFGKGPWLKDETLLRVAGGGRPRIVAGPNAEGLKFGRSLCQQCNNSRSQPFDRAYDVLAEFLAKTASVLTRRSFKLSALYGKEWRPHRDNVLRYFVKHVGCRLAESKLEVPRSLIDFLDQRADVPRGFRLLLGLQLDLLELERHMREDHGTAGGSVWMGDAEAFWSPGRHKIGMVQSHIGFGAIRATYKVTFDDDTYWSNLSRNRVRLHCDFNVPPSEVVGYCSCQSGGQVQPDGDHKDARPGS